MMNMMMRMIKVDENDDDDDDEDQGDEEDADDCLYYDTCDAIPMQQHIMYGSNLCTKPCPLQHLLCNIIT